mgnify:CR=1 FL=1
MSGRAPLLKQALDWAAVWHRGQRRKYPPFLDPRTGEGDAVVPYVSHVAGVVAILSRHGFRDVVLAAGALHDVMEDCGVTYAELAARFGAEVADLVRHASEEDKSASWEERKRRYLERFPGKPWDAQAITLADKIDNLQSIVVCATSFGDPWPLFKRGRDAQLARYRELLTLAHALPTHALIDEYAAALADVEALPA